MNWLKRTPPVPDDAQSRAEELVQAKQRLAEAQELAVSASVVVDTLRMHNLRNHYTDRLALAYTPGGHSGAQ